MTLSEDISRLGAIPLFDGFSAEQLRLLAFGSKRIIFRTGEVLFEQNALSDGAYALLSGQVDLVIDADGHANTAASLFDGSLIGETALIAANRRIATAIARTNVEAIYIPRDLFRRMLSEYPELALLLHERISSSVRNLLSDMGNVQARLAQIPGLSRERNGTDGEAD